MARSDLAASLKTELNDFASRSPVQSHLEQHPAVAVGPPAPVSVDEADHAAQGSTGKFGAPALGRPQPASTLHCGPGTGLDAQTFKRQRVPEKQRESESLSQQTHLRWVK